MKKSTLLVMVGLLWLWSAPLQAQSKQKVVFGVPVTPPNVVHIPPYIAKELGFIGGKMPLQHGPAEGKEGLKKNLAKLEDVRNKVGAALPAHPGLELVATVYGEDLADRSYRETVALLQSDPGLKVVVAPPRSASSPRPRRWRTKAKRVRSGSPAWACRRNSRATSRPGR